MRDDGIADGATHARGQRPGHEHRESRQGVRRDWISHLLRIGRLGQPFDLTVIEPQVARNSRWRHLHGHDLSRLEDTHQLARDARDRHATDQHGGQQHGDRRCRHRPQAGGVPIDPSLVPARRASRLVPLDPSPHGGERRTRIGIEGRHAQQGRRRPRRIRDDVEAGLALDAAVEVRLVGRRHRQRLIVDASERSVIQMSHD